MITGGEVKNNWQQIADVVAGAARIASRKKERCVAEAKAKQAHGSG